MSSRIYGAKDSLQIRVICGAQDSGCPGAMTRMALALWHSRHLDVALGAGGTEKKGKSFFMHFYRFYFANVQLVSVGASSSNMEA